MRYSKLIIITIWIFIIILIVAQAQKIAARQTTWSEEIVLSDDDGYCSDSPAIAVNGENVYVVWTDNRDGCWEIYYKVSHDGGESWTNDTRLSPNDGNWSIQPAVAVEGNIIHVVWCDLNGGYPAIYYQNSVDGGNTWSVPLRISGGMGKAERPKIAAQSGKIHVVWDEKEYMSGASMPNEVYYIRSVDNGKSWNSEVMLTERKNDTIISFAPDIAVVGGTVHVVWEDNNLTDVTKGAIYYRRGVENGTIWDSTALLAETNESIKSIHDPAIATKDNNVYVVWWAGWGGWYSNAEIYFKNSSDNGITWGEDIRVSYNESLSISPSIAVDDFNIHVVWYDHRHDPNMSDFDDVCEIYYKYSNNKGLTWSDDIRITYNESCAWSPKIAVDDCGRTHLVWQDDRDGTWEVYYKRSIQNPPNIDYYQPSDEPIINETGSITFNITASDPDDNNLTYSWYVNDTLLFGKTGNSYTFISDYNSSGVYEIKVVVTDGGFPPLSVNRSWTLTVLNKNRKPMLESIDDHTAYEGQPFTLLINASDPDNDTIMFSDNTTLFDINSTTGLISFTPSYDSDGTYHINITVTDGIDVDYKVFTLTIVDVNRKPTATISSPQDNAKFTTNDNILFDATGSSDPDNGNLIYTWTSSIDGDIGNTKSFSRKLSQGIHTITLTVSDGTIEDYKQITVTVEKTSSQQGGGFIPGFETTAFLVAMVGVCIILLRRRKSFF